MGYIRDKVDHFLFHFSYSLKIKSVIYLTIGGAIFIGVMLLLSQHQLNVSTHNQKLGMDYLKVLNRFYETVIIRELTEQLELTPKQSSRFNPTQLKNEIEIRFSELKEATYTLVDYWGESSPISSEMMHHLNLIHLNVENLLKNDPDARKDIVFLKVEENILNLGKSVTINQELSISIDPITHKLLYLYTELIPQIQRQVTFLLTSPEILTPRDQLPLNTQANLIVVTKSLGKASAEILGLLAQLKGESAKVKEALMDPLTINHLGTFAESIDQFLGFLADNETNRDSLIEIGLPLIFSTFKVSDDIHLVATQLISEQSKTLQWREYFGLGFISFGATVGVAAYTTRLIRRPLYVIRKAAEELAKGNLSARIHVTVKDEVNQISEAFNQMVDQIEMIIQHAGAISDNLATSSTNIFTTAKQIETNVVRQEHAITQIASNAKGVSRTVQDFAKSLQEVSQTATLTTHIANMGRTSLTDMEVIMLQMAKASMNIVKTLSDLQDKVGAINSVINAIVRIADQINLLSLNTAIRSEKPGTHHLGFSVVADKISELADQTALVTLDIEELVQTIIQMVSKCVKIVDNFSDQIRNQVFEAAEISEQLKQLINQTQEQFEAFETINQGMQIQASRASQIHETISSLTDAAQKTTQSVRNLYLEIEYLHHSTGNLRERTKKLTEEQTGEIFFSHT